MSSRTLTRALVVLLLFASAGGGIVLATSGISGGRAHGAPRLPRPFASVPPLRAPEDLLPPQQAVEGARAHSAGPTAGAPPRPRRSSRPGAPRRGSPSLAARPRRATRGTLPAGSGRGTLPAGTRLPAANLSLPRLRRLTLPSLPRIPRLHRLLSPPPAVRRLTVTVASLASAPTRETMTVFSNGRPVERYSFGALDIAGLVAQINAQSRLLTAILLQSGIPLAPVSGLQVPPGGRDLPATGAAAVSPIRLVPKPAAVRSPRPARPRRSHPEPRFTG